MRAIGFEPAWASADVDAETLWAASGGAWLTDRAAGTPTRLVREVVGAARHLDERGAGIAELVPADGLGLLAERAALLGSGPAGRVSSGKGSRLIRARDDWLAVTLARDDDVTAVPAWLASDDGIGASAPLDHWEPVERLLPERPAEALVARGALLGLPVARIGETAGEGVGATRIGEARPASAEGAIVVNLGALWAGPLCGDLLARCGATLITVESRRRPDGVRRRPPFFEALHGRSDSVAVDLRQDEDVDRLRQLLTSADVVIEGSRPRALAQLGLGAEQLAAAGPRVWASITGHGRAQGLRVGFGDDAAAAGGLVATVKGAPRFVADAVADPLTGLIAAATVVQLLETGGRWLADLSLARIARSMSGHWLRRPDRVPVERPAPRRDPGRPMPLGRDNRRWLG